MKSTYYYDQTAAETGRLVVMSRSSWMRLQQGRKPGWLHIWVYGQFGSLWEAQNYFRQELDKHGTLEEKEGLNSWATIPATSEQAGFSA